MRPCDGTSGLVRKNRRKAVFAFKVYLLRWFLIALSALGCLILSRFPEVRGKIENLRAQPDFSQLNCRLRKGKIGVRFPDLAFSPHFRKLLPEVCSKFRNPRTHRLFRVKKQHVEALPLSSAVGMSGICSILPDLAQARLGCLLIWSCGIWHKPCYLYLNRYT